MEFLTLLTKGYRTKEIADVLQYLNPYRQNLALKPWPDSWETDDFLSIEAVQGGDFVDPEIEARIAKAEAGGKT